MRAEAALAAVLALALAPSAAIADVPGRIGPALSTTANGRVLHPAGRQTVVGNFPTGAALSPDGRFLWVVDAGHGHDDVKVVSVASGDVRQTLPLPGAYVGIAFAPDGRSAYVSGEPQGNSTPPADGPTKADGGDAIHVFAVDPATGTASERNPIALPATSGGTAQQHNLLPVPIAPPIPGPGPSSGLGWPEGLAVTPDGSKLVVALNQADQVAIVDLPSGSSTLVKVGAYPYGIAVAPDGREAYVTNEGDGTLSVLDVAGASIKATIGGLGGALGDRYAHPEGLTVDPGTGTVYVAVANRDLIAAVDPAAQRVTRLVSVARPEGVGAQPVDVALAPDRRTLYTADSGEDALAAIALTPRRGVRAFTVVGKIPTAAYPTAVAVTPSGRRLLWVAGKGLGAGPNPEYGQHFAASEAAPYGSYVLDKLLGHVGVMRRPSDRTARALTAIADAQARPADAAPHPAGTPLRPDGPIKHVFYVVRENRTYDQILGTDPRGDGDPSLELFDDNGAPAPTGGVTPNAHRLAQMFPLLDHVYADSEVSVDGHIITSSGTAIDYVQKALHANYGGRGRIDEFGSYPITLPSRGFIFDQAVRQGVSLRNFGELSAGVLPGADDGRSTYRQVQLNTDFTYPFLFGCETPNVCNTDSGTLGPTGAAGAETSRLDHFQLQFDAQLAAGTVPALTYITLPNDHTNGVRQGYPTPRALVADNDLGLGQLVDLISHSSIWRSSAIFVMEDDSQDGADHVDAHRMPAFVISPWARHGAVVHDRYDQLSMLRTTEILLGLHPLALNDALATPMYHAFTTTPDLRPYDAVTPQQSLTERTGTTPSGIDGVLPYDELDAVPQELSDRALWRSVHGPRSTPPPPGPDASPAERERARIALAAFAAGRDLHDVLHGEDAP